MWSLCKYKNVLGKPGTGVHKYRIGNIAIVDVLLTILAAWIIQMLFPNHSFITILLGLFVLGIFMHRVFCVHTTIDRLLFGEPRAK